MKIMGVCRNHVSLIPRGNSLEKMNDVKNQPIVELTPVNFPQPKFTVYITLFEALKMRRTCRSISDKKIFLQLLSDILWAAQGVNRD